MLDTLIRPESDRRLGYRTVAASVRGFRHRRAGEPCQDAHVVAELADGTVLMAVADGAGSAALGLVGATIAINAALRQLRESLGSAVPVCRGAWRDLLWAGAIRAHEAVIGAALGCGYSPKELSTTLILAVVTHQCVAALQIGDGAVVADLTDEGLVALTTPEQGEHPNETTFLTAPDYLQHVHCATRFGRIEAVAAFTDGLQRLAMHTATHSPHVPFFRPLFEAFAGEQDTVEAVVELEEFLASPAILDRTDDDMTLVLVLNRSQAQLPEDSRFDLPEEAAPPPCAERRAVSSSEPSSVIVRSSAERDNPDGLTKKVREAYGILAATCHSSADGRNSPQREISGSLCRDVRDGHAMQADTYLTPGVSEDDDDSDRHAAPHRLGAMKPSKATPSREPSLCPSRAAGANGRVPADSGLRSARSSLRKLLEALLALRPRRF